MADEPETVEVDGQKLVRVQRDARDDDDELTEAERRANLLPPEGDEKTSDGDGKGEPLDDEEGAATEEPEESTHPSGDDAQGVADSGPGPKDARAAASEDSPDDDGEEDSDDSDEGDDNAGDDDESDEGNDAADPVASSKKLRSLDEVLERHASKRKKKAKTKRKRGRPKGVKTGSQGGDQSPRQRALAERQAKREQAQRERQEAASPDFDDDVRPEVWTSGSAVPPVDPPHKRDRMTIEDIEPADGVDFPDLAGRAPPQNLTDLCATYPIGNGLHYIRVERTKPPTYLNQRTAGYLCELRQPISEAQFQNAFGGAEYALIVYGPDPKGTTDRMTGLPKIKALTKPIKVTVPGNPNLEFDPHLDLNPRRARQEDDDMDPFDYSPRRPPRRPATPPSSAEASMHKSNLDFADKQIGRTEEEARRAREEADRARKEATAAFNPALDAVDRANKATIETMRGQLDDMKASFDKLLTAKDEEIRAYRDKVDQLAARPSAEDSAMSAFAQMAKAFAPSERSRDEMTRIYEQHRSEVQRIEDGHKAEMSRQREHMEQSLRWKDEEIKAERQRHEEEKRRMADEHDKRLREQREERDKAVREAEDRHQREIQRLREDHDRELKAVERQHQMVLETRKATGDVQMNALQERVAAAERERDRAMAEKAEASDFTTQMAEFQERAEMLGFQKAGDNEPRDWKERIAAAVGHALMNIDKITVPIAEGMQARAQMQAEARQLPPGNQQQQGDVAGGGGRTIRGADGPIRARRRPTSWASGDGDVSEAEDHTYYQPAPEDRPAQGPEKPPPREQQKPPPQQNTASASPPPGSNGAGAPGAADAEERALSDEERQHREALKAQIEMLRVFIESAITGGMKPEDAADQLLRQATPDQVFALTHSVTADVIIEELSQDPKTQQSPIVRASGQKWLRAAWASAQQKSATARQQQQQGGQPG